jgi:plasmid stabilization system protein ParE
MKNTFKIIWSEEAIKDFREIILYIETNFSEKEVKNFAKKFDRQITLIKTHPQAFPASNKRKTIRRTVVARLTSIYFVCDGEFIKLVSIFDNRKNPQRINF